jgi:hypothetical protein
MTDEPLQDDSIAVEDSQEDSPQVDAQIADGEQQADTGSEQDSQTEPTESLTDDTEIDYEKEYEGMKTRLTEWEDRFKGARSAHDEMAQQLNQMRSTIGDVPLDDAIKAYRDRDRIIPAHDPSSARHGGFKETLKRYEVYQRQIASVAEEDREAVARAWQGSFSEQDVADIKAWESHQQDFGRRLAMHPEEALSDLVDQRVQEVLGRKESDSDLRAKVKSIFDDERSSAAIAAYHDDWMKAMENGKDPFLVSDLLVARHEAEQLRSKLGESSVKEESAKAQKELAKGRSTNQREITPSVKNTDPYEIAKAEAKELGFAPGTPQFNEILLRVQRELQERK